MCENLCSARSDGDALDGLDVNAIDRGADNWVARALGIGNYPSADPLGRGQIEAMAKQIIDCGPTATATATAMRWLWRWRLRRSNSGGA